MSDKTQAQGVSANYTASDVAVLSGYESVTYADSLELAEKLGKSPASIRAKVLSLEIPYVPKPKPVKREKGRTKAETAALIRESLDGAAIPGLEKAQASTLNALLAALS